MDSIAHTHFSSILVTDPALRFMVEAECEESYPASCKLVEAYEKWSASEEPQHSPEKRAYLADFHADAPPARDLGERRRRPLTVWDITPFWYQFEYTVGGFASVPDMLLRSSG